MRYVNPETHVREGEHFSEVSKMILQPQQKYSSGTTLSLKSNNGQHQGEAKSDASHLHIAAVYLIG